MSNATLNIGTEKVGTRIYVTGNTYPVKDQLKAAGCHWDSERKQWWIGAAKADKIAGIVGGMASTPPPKQDFSDKPLLGKANYKGRSYYVLASSDRTNKYRLTVLDGSIDFWADKAACQWEKTYQRSDGDRRGYGRRETTLASIRRFIEDQKSAEKEGIPACPCCGKRTELIHDLEDGMDKCRNCCDMPAN